MSLLARAVLVTSALLLFLHFPAQAETAPAAPAEIPFLSPYEEVISETRHSVGLQAGYGFKLWTRHNHEAAEALPYVAFPITDPVGKGSFFRGVLEYKMEAVIGVITDLENRIMAGGSPIGFRYNFTGLGGRLVPYAELMAGAVYADYPKKINGSRFNFIESIGVGAQYFISRRTTLNIEFRFWHLSNAGITGPNYGNNLGFVLVGMGFY